MSKLCKFVEYISPWNVCKLDVFRILVSRIFVNSAIFATFKPPFSPNSAVNTKFSRLTAGPRINAAFK